VKKRFITPMLQLMTACFHNMQRLAMIYYEWAFKFIS